jgi:hypothetical protein
MEGYDGGAREGRVRKVPKGVPGSSCEARHVTLPAAGVAPPPSTRRIDVSDGHFQADTDACAREARAAIEGVLERRCPELKIAFWTAVDRHYRRDAPSGPRQGAPASPSPDLRAPTQPR